MREIRHLPMNGYECYLRIKAKRGICESCDEHPTTELLSNLVYGLSGILFILFYFVYFMLRDPINKFNHINHLSQSLMAS